MGLVGMTKMVTSKSKPYRGFGHFGQVGKKGEMSKIWFLDILDISSDHKSPVPGPWVLR